jgi:polar amino acid transport system ATP-binding protein
LSDGPVSSGSDPSVSSVPDPSVSSGSDPPLSDPTPPVLSCRGVTKVFGSTPVLRGIDLDVAETQVVVLIGASGSGKSTLLRCVNLLETVSDGVIRLDGEDITDPRADAVAVRRRIGTVFQAYNLFPHMTVLDNVTLAPRVVQRLPVAEARARAMELLTRVGLADKAKEYPDRLSGGQAQRTAIARALCFRPRLLLLDEITSALDPELVGEVLALVGELKDQAMTILMATHEMAFARDVADTVCFLDGGVISEIGPPEQVIGAPTQARTRQFLDRIINSGRL